LKKLLLKAPYVCYCNGRVKIVWSSAFGRSEIHAKRKAA